MSRILPFLPACYFGLLWFFLSEEHRFIGAFIVTMAGVLAVQRLRAAQPILEQHSPADRANDVVLVDAIEGDPSNQPESAERRRARFLGALGHELRNPLNSVTGFSDMLLSGAEGPLNVEQERSVRTIRESAERLLRLVSTVVDQARIEAGTLRMQQQWVTPSEIVAETTRFVRARTEGRTMIADVAAELPRVFVDRHRTIQALVGLAVWVIRSSGLEVSMRVAPPRRDQGGPGFVQFDLMTSLEHSSADPLSIVEWLERPASRSDALGLEVRVARGIIEAQGGRMWAEAGTAGSLRVCATLPTSAR